MLLHPLDAAKMGKSPARKPRAGTKGPSPLFNLIATFLRGDFLPSRRKEKGRGRRPALLEQLEARAMLSITANDANYDASSAGTLNVAAPGLLADCTDSGGYQMSAYMMGGP
ncbi:MAG TPA: hypothetical protein VNH11_16080, partial [Pirellulales bacterium]|nr:hypothetical protein [Pirellulales bacterium]